MGELGELLRKTREAKGLSLAQVEEATKIRSVYLQALEEEDDDCLPPPVYVKGFLRNYARYLDLDPQQVLSLYQESEATTPATPAQVMLDEPLEPLTLRRWWPAWVVLLVIAVVVAVWWGYQRYYGTVPVAQARATPTPTCVPSSPTPEPPTATPSPTLTASPTPTPTTAIALEVSIELVGQQAWLLVHVDGEMVFTGTLEPGATRTWRADERIVLHCGNAGAVRVTVNGQTLGPMGEPGQVIEKEWTAPGVPTRTPEPTPSPTITP